MYLRIIIVYRVFAFRVPIDARLSWSSRIRFEVCGRQCWASKSYQVKLISTYRLNFL